MFGGSVAAPLGSEELALATKSEIGGKLDEVSITKVTLTLSEERVDSLLLARSHGCW